MDASWGSSASAARDLRRLPPGETIKPFHFSEERWGFDEYDVANQRLTSHHVAFQGGKIHYSSGSFRYVWPSELDLMAEVAGLRLRERWDGWTRAPFTSESRQHVSVWHKPAGTESGWAPASFTPGQFAGRIRVGDDFDDPLPDEILDDFERRP